MTIVEFGGLFVDIDSPECDSYSLFQLPAGVVPASKLDLSVDQVERLPAYLRGDVYESARNYRNCIANADPRQAPSWFEDVPRFIQEAVK